MRIENQSTYAKFKILRSLFSKKMKKPFHIMVFEDRSKKLAYDHLFRSMLGYNNDYSKKKIPKSYEPDGHYRDAIIKSMTLNKKEKPITLLYYLKE